MPKRKRDIPSKLPHLVDATVGINEQLCSLFGSCREESSKPILKWLKAVAHDELYRYANTETPYGTIVETSIVKGRKGELLIEHSNPFAFFCLLHIAYIQEICNFDAGLCKQM